MNCLYNESLKANILFEQIFQAQSGKQVEKKPKLKGKAAETKGDNAESEDVNDDIKPKGVYLMLK